MAAMGGGGEGSYWFDACEDDGGGGVGLCSIDFAAEFDPSMLPLGQLDAAAGAAGDDGGFLGEIDRILESINGPPPPPPPPSPPPPVEAPQVSPAAAPVVENGVKSDAATENGVKSRAGNPRTENGCARPYKRPRFGDRMHERGFCNRYRDPRRRDVERRPRELDRGGWKRDRDGRDGEWRERESRGYWERDRSGKLAFKVGPWETEAGRDAKRPRQESPDGDQGGRALAEAKLEEQQWKERPAEEQARKYQLDVLEQAKKKNTIAFLETGAGKTLIAVMLIKSLCSEMLKDNKKMLAIFLVPKVPLVYQQAEVIRERTGLKVGHYCGEMGQDFWDSRRWQREFESKQARPYVWFTMLLFSLLKFKAICKET